MSDEFENEFSEKTTKPRKARPSSSAPQHSEAAIALTFAERYANTLRYVAEWNQWFRWDGTCWREDKTLDVFDLACALCCEDAIGVNKMSLRRQIASAKTRAAVVSVAGADRRIAATVDQWDQDPWLLNAPNGVVDLRTGELREHRVTDYMTKQTAVPPDGDCPLWKKFMTEITSGDGELQRYLQRLSGYCLTGATYEQELFFFYGTGCNGKGVFVQTISGILHDYHRASSIETFTVSNTERHPTELATLVGARLVTAAETEEGRRWSEARIKELTGGDKITARFMRQDPFDFFPQFKLLFSGNHMPALRGVNRAMTRRFNRIPFAVTIAADRVDVRLVEKLKEEWSGILAWAVEGCLEWQRIGLSPPKAVTVATESYLESQDVLGEWLDECCEIEGNVWVSSADLYDSWQDWATERGEWVGSAKTFVQRLEDRGGLRKHRNLKERGFIGLRLRAPGQQSGTAVAEAGHTPKSGNGLPPDARPLPA